MKSIQILYDSYQPSTAGTNHLLAYVKGLAELGTRVYVYYLFPDERCSKLNSDGFVKHIFLWEKQKIFQQNKYICSLSCLIRFCKIVDHSIPLYVVGTSMFLPIICLNKKLTVYHERTEHPLVSGTLPGPLGRLLFKWYSNTIKQIKGLFVISNNLKKCFVEEYGLQEENVHVINMVVDADRFAGIKKNKAGKVIAYCGTASNNKDGVDQLVKSFALVSQKYPDSRLMIIGKTPDKGQEFSNAQLVKELGIENKVEFTGIVSSIDMPQILKDADILALDRPDNIQAKYGFPTKLGEYLLTENPVVVTTVGDIPSFLTDKESAMLANPEDPQDFADKIIWLFENPDSALSIGQKGKKVAMMEFNYLQESKKLYDVIFKYSNDD